jgi:D-aminopeptidase
VIAQFRAVIEATEEAIINSILKAETMVGRDGNTRIGIPIERVIAITSIPHPCKAKLDF